MLSAGLETINFIRKLREKSYSIPLFLLFKTEVSGVSCLTERAGVSQYADAF